MRLGVLVIGIVMIVIAFLLFPLVLDSADTILEWEYAGTDNYTISSFTGLEQLVAITPLLVFIGLLAGGGWLTFTGIRGEGGGRSRGRGLH